MTNLFFPFLGYYRFNWFAQAMTVFMVGFTAFAIIRYRFTGVQFIFHRFLNLIISSIFVLLIFYGLVLYHERLSGGLFTMTSLLQGLIIAPLFVLIATPVFKAIDRRTRRWVLHTEYSMEETGRQLVEEMRESVFLDDMMNIFLGRVNQTIGIKYGVSYLNYNDEEFILGEVVGSSPDLKEAILFNDPIRRWFSKHREVVVTEEVEQELEEASQTVPRGKKSLAKSLASCQAKVAFPIISKDKRMLGFIFFGEKFGNTAYTKEDIDFIEIMLPQLSVAVENALLYTNLDKEVKRRTQQLQETNQKLAKALEAKQDFMHIASHQLRTPVSIVAGSLELATDGTVKGKEKDQFVEDALVNMRRLQLLIKDLLTATSLDGEEVRLVTEKFDIYQDVLVPAQANLAGKAAGKGLTLELKSQLKRASFEGDKTKIIETINSLLENAINYTPKGGIILGLRRVDDMWQVSCADTGIGLSQDSIKGLFRKFNRAENAKKVRPDGTGLGLYVAKQLVEAHNGKVWVESPGEGKGSTFYVQLPVKGVKGGVVMKEAGKTKQEMG